MRQAKIIQGCCENQESAADLEFSSNSSDDGRMLQTCPSYGADVLAAVKASKQQLQSSSQLCKPQKHGGLNHTSQMIGTSPANKQTCSDAVSNCRPRKSSSMRNTLATAWLNAAASRFCQGLYGSSPGPKPSTTEMLSSLILLPSSTHQGSKDACFCLLPQKLSYHWDRSQLQDAPHACDNQGSARQHLNSGSHSPDAALVNFEV